MSRSAVATDDFNRAGPALGANWANLYSSGIGDVVIGGSDYIGNNVGSDTGEGAAARWVGTGTFADDQYSSLVLENLSWQSGLTHVGVICRASADTEGDRDFYWAAVVYDGAGPSYRTEFGKIVDGTRTEFHTASVSWANGDRVELECEGTTIRVLKNGTALGGSFTTTDSAIASGKPGVCASGTPSARGDDWEGGDIVAAGDPEGSLAGGKLIGGGLLIKGVLVP